MPAPEAQPGDVIRWVDSDGTERTAVVGLSPEYIAARTPLYALGFVRTSSGRVSRV
ncbi:hypothetical protein ACFOYW_13390 [Gryllotalpicola reticulitermitis]|uniref:DUF1918 domain-containing protein n=1 Tax=Gryllotalpicola reticulitermitis TaxID=1184153 RepID=A0ABV8Q9N8_9MICO